MRVRPTTLGTKGLILLGALEFTFLASGYRNLFFLIIAFCCTLGGLCLVWSLANLRGLAARLCEPPSGPADTARPLRLELRLGRKTRFDLAIELRVCGRWIEVVHLPAGTGAIQLDGRLPGLPRGVHEVQGLRILTRFPFGFFLARLDLPVFASILTYPNPDAAGADARSRDRHACAQVIHPGQRSPSVAGLRPFRTGDSLADVHWKATARRGTAIVKERESEGGLALEVAIDRRCPEPDLESALATTTGLVLARRHDERTLHLRSQDCVLEIGPRRNGEQAALIWLASTARLPATAAPVAATSAGCFWLPARTQEAGNG